MKVLVVLFLVLHPVYASPSHWGESGSLSLLDLDDPSSTPLKTSGDDAIRTSSNFVALSVLAYFNPPLTLFAALVLFSQSVSATAAPDTWGLCSPMPTARLFPCVFCTSSHMYVAGGILPPPVGVVSMLERYEVAADTWVTLNSVPSAMDGTGAGVVGPDGFFVGYDNDPTYKYTIALDTWVAVSTKPTPRSNLGVGHTTTDLFAIAGGSSAVTEKYAIASDTWVTVTSIPTARQQAGVASFGSNVYVAGGMDGPIVTKLEIYNAETDTWKSGAPMPSLRRGCSAAATGLDFFVTSGYAGVFLTTNEKYSINTDTWVTVAASPSGRYALAAGVVSETVYLVGGGDPQRTAVEKYVMMTSTPAPTPAPTTPSPTASPTASPTPSPTPAPGPAPAPSPAWKALTASPAQVQTGTAHVSGNEAFFFGIGVAFKYTVAADAWAAINASPSVRRASSSAENPLHPGKILVVGGWDNSVRYKENEQYSVALDTWETKADFPVLVSSPGCATVTSVSKMICAGGDPVPGPGSTINYEYSFNTDTWAAKSPCPVIYRDTGAASDGTLYYTVGSFAANTGAVHVYDPAAGLWTTKTSSPNLGRAGDGLAFTSSDNSLYQILGTSLAQYTISTDTWTLLDASPVAFTVALTAMVGNMFVVNSGSGTATYGFEFAAPRPGIVGDPVLTTLMGTQHHLALRSGVFTLFRSPNLLVNVMVDTLPTLPPGDNTVVVAVGMRYSRGRDSALAVCSAAVNITEAKPSCKFTSTFDVTGLSPDDNFAVFHFGEYSVEVQFRDYSASSYLNVVFPSPPSPTTPVCGLLTDLDSYGHFGVDSGLALGANEVLSGALLTAACDLS